MLVVDRNTPQLTPTVLGNGVDATSARSEKNMRASGGDGGAAPQSGREHARSGGAKALIRNTQRRLNGSRAHAQL